MLPIVLAWEQFKDWLSASAHVTHWQLHVVCGLGFFLLFARVWRRPLTSLLPIAPVALLELGNETLDFLRAWIPRWPWNWRDTLIEIALTLGPPLLVVLAARAWPAARRRVRFPPRREPIRIAVKDDRPRR